MQYARLSIWRQLGDGLLIGCAFSENGNSTPMRKTDVGIRGAVHGRYDLGFRPSFRSPPLLLRAVLPHLDLDYRLTDFCAGAWVGEEGGGAEVHRRCEGAVELGRAHAKSGGLLYHL
eukprot:3687089-Pleurochrysis_carterae.AAC.1